MRRLVLLFAAAAFLAGCGQLQPAPQPPPATHSAAAQNATTQPDTYPASWPLPDHALTPGAIATTDIHRLCPHVDPALEAARPASSDKAKVYAAYGLTYPQPAGKYELDHRVPIELGGAPNDPANEWPELNNTPDPAAIARWHLSAAFVHNSKDVLEDVTHIQLCAGQITIAQAQDAFLGDWRAAYARYVGMPLP